MGGVLHPVVRDCPDHAHMIPGLIRYLKKNNFKHADDFLGRNNGTFYRSLYNEEITVTDTEFFRHIKTHNIPV
eukprot:CAMPEP_0168331804 /NCGR_PEP_ID=MMETSP0213-20121227/8554_1 /TAXON_ID=151035 /ORGANISM="Euplotes harpa, Strain FSP1.4" /LENGTH=72 /DNA_ID=CAMNT_0008335655 /DNA_START=310 /DNA_END=528 /DNA_ORIENTATION=+